MRTSRSQLKTSQRSPQSASATEQKSKQQIEILSQTRKIARPTLTYPLDTKSMIKTVVAETLV